MCRQHPTRRCDAKNVVVGDSPELLHRVGKVSVDRDGVRLVIQHDAGIATNIFAVDDGENRARVFRNARGSRGVFSAGQQKVRVAGCLQG